MFPEISRDDVFRLETRNLWLRWPVAADAAIGVSDIGGTGTPEEAAGDPYRDAAILAAWRDDNTTGRDLHLVMTGRGIDRHTIGAADLVPVRGRAEDCGLRLRAWIDLAERGRGLGTEAVQAMVDAAFMLSDTPLVAASTRVLDPASRRVLEKCGFSSCGTGLDPAPDGHGLAASDRFRLDRKAWVSLKGWRVPGVSRQRGAGDAAGCCAV